MKIKFTAIASLLLLTILTLCSCNSQPFYHSSAPREIVGIMEYTGATFNPIATTKPYPYAIDDIDGNFTTYLDTTKLVVPEFKTFLDKVVIAKGSIHSENGILVMRVESLKIK